VNDRQRRIVEDLTGVLRGEIRCDAVTTGIYAADASLYQITPVGVAFPRDADDVVQLAKYASEQSLSLVARGAGTSVAGAAVGAGLIVDFSRFMTRVLDDRGDTIRVEPGVVLERLNRRFRDSGRYFPPDPATAAVTTIGGMIATNAAGSHSIAVGTTRDHVRSLSMTLANGESFEAACESVLASSAEHESPAKRELIARLAQLLSENADRIEAKRPKTKRNNCGYHVWDVLTPTELDLAGLLVGSEGTLGLFTAATIKVSPLPVHRGVTLLLFEQIESAFDAVQAVLPSHPAACDLIDRRLLSLAREGDERFESLIAPSAEAALLIEVFGDTAADVQRRLDDVLSAARRAKPAIAARWTTDAEPEAVDFLWTLPGKVVPRLTKLKGRTRPLPFVEDVAVPPEAMQEFRVRAQKVFQRHQVTATLYAHAGDGQMHFRPFLPPPEVERQNLPLEAISRDLYQIVLSLGGVVSGEHGDGLARTAFVRTQYGPLYPVFQKIKEIFDPRGLLNPGKIISDDAKVTIRHLRPTTPEPPAVANLNLRWTPQRMTEEAVRCNGCGNCRSQEPDLRMCPFFRVMPAEDAAPRSKATAMRLIATGELSGEALTGPEMAHLASLCFNCKQCERECPSEVDIPHLVLEAKSARVAAEGLRWSDWALTRTHVAGPIGSGLSFAANRLLASPAGRWLLEKSAGVSRYRKLPPFARRPFLRSLPPRCRSLRTGPQGQKAVIYFVDEFANRHDPDLARAFVAVMERQGIPVHVPTEQLPSGMALISAGDFAAARELAEENIRVLAPLAREGHRIVCTEPSAVVCLKREYPFLLDHPDVEVVSKQTIEAGAFLAELDAVGKFDRQLHPLKLALGYHTPCHVRSETPQEPFRQLLALIPGLELHKIDSGCSGMAGVWGLSAENFRTSVRIGWPLISGMRDERLAGGTTECSSCRLQMEQGTTKPTLHPLKLLAASYAGRMPTLPKSTNRLLTT
jgi:FAD/FMN-containing dehydrogenase/Fe-S oxidoreductase